MHLGFLSVIISILFSLSVFATSKKFGPIGIWKFNGKKCQSGAVLSEPSDNYMDIGATHLVHRYKNHYRPKSYPVGQSLFCDFVSDPIKIYELTNERLILLKQDVRLTVKCPSFPPEFVSGFVTTTIYKYQLEGDVLFTSEDDEYMICRSYDDQYDIIDKVFKNYKRMN